MARLVSMLKGLGFRLEKLCSLACRHMKFIFLGGLHFIACIAS